MNAQAYAQDLMLKLYKEADSLFNTVLPYIPLEFSSRLTKTGGYFRFRGPQSVKIVLSSSIMAMNNTQKFIDEVLTHEFAHFVTHEVYGANVQAHGREWKSVMRKLGAKPNRCHSFKTKKSNTFKYNVDGQIIELGIRRHNKIQSGYTSYRLRGGSQILANMYMGASKPTTKPKATRKVKGKTKANIARDLIKSWKSLGITQAQVLGSAERIQEVCWKANLTTTMAKRYLKNLWEQV